jgi:hypothetical protein
LLGILLSSFDENPEEFEGSYGQRILLPVISAYLSQPDETAFSRFRNGK